MIRKRNERQEEIRSIVRTLPISTQRDLVAELSKRGFPCTQATVSRDIVDMGLHKLSEGIYVLAEDVHLQRMVRDLVTDVVISDKLVLVKTFPGTAPGIAAAIDAASLGGVLGTVSGNDTILVITSSEESAHTFADLIDRLRNAR